MKPCGFLLVLLLATLLGAQQSPDEARELARNPVADAIKIPLVEDIFVDAGPYGRMPNTVQLQPVIPLQISEQFLLVPRVVATAFAYLPDLLRSKGSSIGLGDTIVTLFITPRRAGKVIWGIGPAILVPTATDASLGGGKWDVGPSFVLLTESEWGSAGAIVQNIWSLPGDRRRASVDQIQIETSFSYNLAHGWYLITAPTLGADWTQQQQNRWLVPVGAGMGRTFEARRQSIDANVALYYNAIRPAGPSSPRWLLSLQLTLLLPRDGKPSRNDR